MNSANLSINPQKGPSFVVTDENGALSFGIADPSGLSNQSRGLIGQFLGFLNFQVVGEDDLGTLMWSSQTTRAKHEHAKMAWNAAGSCWTFINDWEIKRFLEVHM